MLTLTQLEYIVAVDTYRHFVTASEKCFVTQPTLSMQIKKLEEDLGVVLFDRSRQPIVPTEIGEKIIAQARTVIAESKRIEEIVNEEQQTVSGEITIGIIPSLAPYLLPRFIGTFNRDYPAVKVNVVELLTEEILEQLKTDLIDVGILVTPLNEKGIEERPLFYEQMLLYVNRSHLFGQQPQVRADEIATPDLWLLSKGHCFRSQVINLCSFKANATANFRFNYESGSLETLKKFVDQEGGYTLLPELAVDEEAIHPLSVIRNFAGSVPLREVGFATSRNYTKKRLLDLLAGAILAAVPAEMQDAGRGQIVEWR